MGSRRRRKGSIMGMVRGAFRCCWGDDVCTRLEREGFGCGVGMGEGAGGGVDSFRYCWREE